MTHIETGVGRRFARGDELGRFNMGSTVVLLLGHRATRFAGRLGTGATLRLGQALARVE
jgi:phosphatidylserine decarboxylase